MAYYLGDANLLRPIGKMSQAINCNFARAAVRALTQKHRKSNKHVPDIDNVLKDFNEHFTKTTSLQTTSEIAQKRFLDVSKIFLRKWKGKESRQQYLKTFSMHAWQQLSDEEQQEHTLTDCEACKRQYSELTKAFPAIHKHTCKHKPHMSLTYTETPGKTPPKKSFIEQVTKELDTVCHSKFGASFGELLEQTPSTGLQKRLTSQQQLKAKRQILKEVKNSMEQNMESKATDMVMGARTSWKTFNKLRLTVGLEDKQKTKERQQKRKSLESENTPPAKKKVHGYTDEHIETLINADHLLEEAKTWSPTKKINWSAIGANYGLTSPNRGQIVKEYLAQHDIPAAKTAERPHRLLRRAKMKFQGGRVSFPICKPVKVQKAKIAEKIQSGEINIGTPILETTHSTFLLDSENREIVPKSVSVSSHLISLLSIREKLLKKHEDMGLIRNYTEKSIQEMARHNIQEILVDMRVNYDSQADTEVLRSQLWLVTATRHFKVWHDHSALAGHGHFLLTVSGIYDCAFYYTKEEMAQNGVSIDVERVIEQPEIYILGRSKASIVDQGSYNQARIDDLQCLRTKLNTQQGIAVTEVLKILSCRWPCSTVRSWKQNWGALLMCRMWSTQ